METKNDLIGNKKSIWSTNGCSNHSKTERESSDFYATDSIAIDKLAAKFRIPKNVWECAAGKGNLSERLKEMGHNVYSTELVDRGYGITGVNFLTELSMPVELPHDDVCILTNPPYRMTTEFILHALELLPIGGQAVFLLKTTALEGKGRFERIYRNTPPPISSISSSNVCCAQSRATSRHCEIREAPQWHTHGSFLKKDIEVKLS